MSKMPGLVESLRIAAEAHPDLGFTFLGDDLTPQEVLTYRDLDLGARRIAATLHARGIARGARVLLLYPPGLEFLRALYGVLYAGCVAVPVPPPNPARLERTLPRLRHIAQDCGIEIVLSSSTIHDFASVILPMVPELAHATWLATETIDGSASDWNEVAVSDDAIVLLQYTSGSTGNPRGVTISHGNLRGNIAACQRFSGGAVKKFVTWLPVYHDMGLIGGAMTPAFVAGECTMMSPLTFLQDPVKWLKAVSASKAMGTGAPNFAFELCTRKVTDEQVATLDLSNLDFVFCGAEPIRAATLERFCAKFEPAGLRRSTIRPCYGLAEATLMVSGVLQGGPTTWSVDPEELRKGRASTSEAPNAYTLVGCGRPIDTEVVIADENGQPCAPGQIGEIWVRGPGVGEGYWRREAESVKIFGAKLVDGRGPFLRTGDLGTFAPNGELCVTGRTKDLIIVRGRNYYPQDIELSVESVAGIRKGGVAAFALDADRGESVAVVAEYDSRRGPPAGGWDDVAQAINTAVGEDHEIAIASIRLVAPGQMPKTPSGKVQRARSRQLHVEGGFETLHEWTAGNAAGAQPDRPASVTPTAGPRTAGEIMAFMTSSLSEKLGRKVGPQASFASLGLDSLEIVSMIDDLREWLGRPTLAAAAAVEHPSIDTLAAYLAEAPREANTGPVAPPITRTEQSTAEVTSFWQDSVLEWERARPPSPTWTEPLRLRLRGPLDVPAVEEAIRRTLKRHEILRKTFSRDTGSSRLCEIDEVRIRVTEAPGGGERLEAIAAEHAESFLLDSTPLVRFDIVRAAADDHTLFVSWHQLVHDATGAWLLATELLEEYDALKRGPVVERPPVDIRYADYAVWERNWFGGEGKALIDKARERIYGASPLEPPVARTRNGQSSPLAVTLASFAVDDAARFAKLCESLDTTFFSGLVAAVSIMLGAWCKTEDVVFMSPVSTRMSEEVRNVIGRFGTWVPTRISLAGAPTVREVFARARKQAVYAVEPVPGSLVYDTKNVFDHPLNRVIVNMPESDSGSKPKPIEVAGISAMAEPFPSPPGARGDLGILVARRENRIVGMFQGAADLFDEATIREGADALARIISNLREDARVSDLIGRA